MSLQELNDMLHDGPVGHRDERLWTIRRNRSQTRPFASRHDNGFHDRIMVIPDPVVFASSPSFSGCGCSFFIFPFENCACRAILT